LTALAGIAVDVISLFMALLSSRGISTPSLQAQGEQRRSSYFNIHRDIARLAPHVRQAKPPARAARQQLGAGSSSGNLP
jgi:hypothetical protein